MRSVAATLMFVACVFLTSCGPNSRPGHLMDVYAGKAFYYLDQADRITVLQGLSREILDNYALLGIKQARHVVDDPKALFDLAIAAEGGLADAAADDILAQASSNLAFLDRTVKIIAAFQDTHLSVSQVVPRPEILDGLSLALVGGDVRIVAINQKILKYDTMQANDGSTASPITLGDKVIAIDGKPVLDRVQELLPYIGQSSPQAQFKRAIALLTSRSFLYPAKSYADWQIESLGTHLVKTMRIPYYYMAMKHRADALYYLKAHDFTSIDNLNMSWDPEKHIWEPNSRNDIQGYDPRGIPEGMIDATSWFDQGKVAERTGYLLHDGRAYGVLQLFSLAVDKVTAKSDDNAAAAVDFFDPITAFVKTLKSDKVPLIIDLRYNSGGDPLHSAKILSLIAAGNAVYPDTTRAFRISRLIRQMMDNVNAGTLPVLDHYDFDTTAVAQVQKAIEEKRAYTAVFSLEEDIRADQAVQGYPETVVALIGPQCVSACDGLSILLQTSARAKLIGSTANGTGAGFFGKGQYDPTTWQDEYGVITAHVPNRLFGFPGKVGQHVYPADDAYLTFNTENRPTVADVPYTESLDDYLHGGRDVLQKAIEVIEQ